jgi:hypothetical protein
MDVDVKEVISIVSDSQMMATTIGATPGQHLPSNITTVINLTIQILHRRTTSSTAPLQPLWPRTMLVTNYSRRHLWSIPVPRGTYSTICPSSTDSSLSHPRLSSWATTRQPTVLRLVRLCTTCLTGVVFAFLKSFFVLRLAINLLSVSQLAKKGIMTSFTKTGCALIDSDDGNCLLAEASITTGGLYAITKAVRRASLAARTLSATAASSSSKILAPLSKDMQMLWHARLGHVGI